MHKKTCTKCGVSKPLSAFYLRAKKDRKKYRTLVSKRRDTCKECTKRRRKESPMYRWKNASYTLRKRGASHTAEDLRDNMGLPGICYLCGEHIELGDAAIDHVIPQDKGGTHDFENLRWTHFVCNASKWNLTLPEYISLLCKIIAHQASQNSERSSQV